MTGGASVARDDAAIATAALRVVVLDETGPVVARLREVLAGSEEERRFALTPAPTPTLAIERARAGAADVVLLAVAADRNALAPLLTLRAEAPGVPVVVVCAADAEPLAIKAVQLGATDYLVLERMYATVVSRSLRHAVESARVRAALAERTAAVPVVPARGASLRVVLPERFAALVASYGEILDRAVEQVLHRRPASVDEALQRLAEEITDLRAGPRDVVDLHAAALKQREADHGAQRMQVYLAEGRMRLLELMGKLVTIYRDHWLHALQAPRSDSH